MADLASYDELRAALDSIGRDLAAEFWSVARAWGLDGERVGQLAALVRLACAHGEARERDEADRLRRLADRRSTELYWLRSACDNLTAERDRLRAALRSVRDEACYGVRGGDWSTALDKIWSDAARALGEGE